MLSEKPFRGPDNFEQNDFKYANTAGGDINNFKGEEKIFYKDKLIYELFYHGGSVLR